jgi:DNA-binding XRE family transcriptional regulator
MKDVILLRLADQIRSMRAQRGLSQSHLAAAAGVNRKTIIELEKGSAGIALGTVVAVLESMGGELSVVPASKPTTAEVQSLLGLEPSPTLYNRRTTGQIAGKAAHILRRVSSGRTTKPAEPPAGGK